MSLAISGRFLVIFAELMMTRTSRRHFFHEMVDFPIRKRYFGGRVRKEHSGRPLGEKKGDSVANLMMAFCDKVFQNLSSHALRASHSGGSPWV